MQVTAVIEPRHGVEPTARQLAETIDRIKAADVNVLFAEKYFASKLSDTIREATGVKMYSISHISSGEYTPEKFVDEMRENLTTLATAINEAAQERLASHAGSSDRVRARQPDARRHVDPRGRELQDSRRHDSLHRRRQRRRQDLARALAARPDAALGPHQHRVARQQGHRLRAAVARFRQEPADHGAATSWRWRRQRRPVFLGVSRARRARDRADARATGARRQARHASSAACRAASGSGCCLRRR